MGFFNHRHEFKIEQASILMAPLIKTGLLILTGLIFSHCDPPLTYRMEKLSGPVGLVAIDQVTHTNINFYSFNRASDFTGYQIFTGNTETDAINNTTALFECAYSSVQPQNLPVKVQLGGASNSTSADCYDSTLGPLTAGTWIRIAAKGSRDCTPYGSDCSNISASATSQVLEYVAPPVSANIQSLTDYYQLDVTMGAVHASFNGIGLFYSPSEDEAHFKATNDGSFVDGFCIPSVTVTPGYVVKIQIGGTLQPGMDCHITNFYLNSGDFIAVRNSVSNRTIFPWSEYVPATVP